MNNKIEIEKVISNFEECKKFLEFELTPATSEAIITYFAYKKLNPDLIIMLKKFVKNHLKFNTKSTIFIFTNFVDYISPLFFNDRIKVIYFPFYENLIMASRLFLYFYSIRKFIHFDKVFFLDTDLIAINSYENIKCINDQSYDIGITFQNDWHSENRFPINGGVLICNYKGKNKKIFYKFSKQYIHSFMKIIKNQHIIFKSQILNHDIVDLSKWFGDQYLYFDLLPDKLDTVVDIFSDINYLDINYRLLNSRAFNFAPLELKRKLNNSQFKIFMDDKLRNTIFVHLKGKERKYYLKKL